MRDAAGRATLKRAAWLLAGCLQALSVGAETRSVFVQLFEWRWPDVALECEQVLGPAGFAAVQVSPPNEHVDHRDPALHHPYAWWARYQPVSYDLISRSGTEAEFRDMVRRCDDAGVGIYVDAVVNHMADQVGRGVAGTPFDVRRRAYRDYRDEHFNRKCVIEAEDYRRSDDPAVNAERARRIRRCQLLDLPDLDTGHPQVQATLAAYLQRLLDMGVAGFRIDAAKHIFPEDIAALLGRLDGNFYTFLEVVDTRGEPVGVFDYAAVADVTEFLYSKRVGEAFASGRLAGLRDLDVSGGLLPSDKAVVFVDNHDNQRGHGMAAATTHRDGRVYDLANIFMLAWPYGYPKLMSSYAWGGEDDSRGPPRDDRGNTLPVHSARGDVDCGGEHWVCEHRRLELLRMVDFRNRARAAGAVRVGHWWDNGRDQFAFAIAGEQGFGFLAINRNEARPFSLRLQTGLPAGAYCNLVGPGSGGTLLGADDGRLATPACRDGPVAVDKDGTAEIEVGPLQALVIDRERRL